MPETQQYIAVDLGAESGRVMLARISSDKIALEEIYRFNNVPIEENNSLRWDFNSLLSEIKAGICTAVKRVNGKISGIGIDSWGVSFGLIGSDGKLLENPHHYRDGLSNGMIEKACELVSKRELYKNTGLPLTQINSVYQLLAMHIANAETLAKAKKLLFIADLFSYHLCDRLFSEYTLASTSQLMDMRTGKWSQAVFNKLSLPILIMPPIVKPGTIVGNLTRQIASELGCDPIPVIAVGSHDTASAVAAIPALNDNWAFLSSGTWSILGVETKRAIVNDAAFEYQFANEGGVENTIQFLKNIMGLWLIQECKRQWSKDGEEITYAKLMEMAQKAKPFVAFLDPDHNGFFGHGDLPERINSYFARTGQGKIKDNVQITRIILESLAFKYQWVLERLEVAINKKVDSINVVGGGAQNEMLCQFTANVTGKQVFAGPIEATSIGNALMQAKATGQIKSLTEGRKLVQKSFSIREYLPRDSDIWAKQYKKTEQLISG